ncbi:MAG: hypothetical protein U1F10_02115 [Burkholderiales bacterium]
MQRIALVPWIAAFAAASAFAQTPAPTAAAPADAAKPATAYKYVEPREVAVTDNSAAAAPYKVVEGRAIADYPPPSKLDPRVCLEFPSQAQIITCANKYLPKRRT